MLTLSSPRREAIRTAALVMLVLMPVWLFVTLQQAYQALRQDKERCQQLLDLHGRALEHSFGRIESELQQLESSTQARGSSSISEFAESFDVLAIGLHADSQWVQAYQFVEGGRIEHSFPVEGNEAALGADLRVSPYAEVVQGYARTEGTDATTLTGPIELMQGGTGIVLRRRLRGAGDPPRSVAIVVRLQPLLMEAGLSASVANGLNVSIRKDAAAAFFGQSEVFLEQPVLRQVAVPEGSWEIGAVPHDGWGTAYWSHMFFYGSYGSVLLAVAGATTYVFSFRQQFLANSRAEKRRELLVTNAMLAHDIRWRSAAEEALRGSESRFRRMFEQAGDGFVVVDVRGTIQAANRMAAEIVGYSTDELPGRQVLDLIAPEHLPEIRLAQVRSRLMDGETIREELSLVKKDSSKVSVELSVRGLDQENYLTVFRDLTARCQADYALRDQQERMRILADTLPGQLLYADCDERIQYANVSAEREFAQPTDAAVQTMTGRLLAEIFPAARYEAIRPWIQKVLFGETVEFTLTDDLTDPAGRSRNFIFAPHELADGFIPGFYALETDITARRRAELKRDEFERHLMHAQKMEAVGTLAGGIAHDFNNMLQVILGYSDISLVLASAQPALKENLIAIKKAAKRSADLTYQLLAFARQQTITPVAVNLTKAVPRILRLMRRVVGEDIRLSWEPKEPLWTMLIDPLQLDQILANILVNARDAIAGPGKIVVSARNVSAATVSGSSAGIFRDSVVLEVADNGRGMQEAVQSRIFEPFFTTKEPGEGSGLGLATVYGIVTQNGGTIHVQSEPGKGTSLSLYFPKSADVPPIPDIRPIQDISRTGHETILLVEDEPMVLSLSASVLQRLGYQVIVAKSPAEALRIAESNAQVIQLLVTDVVMPGMNGKDLSEILLVQRPQMRVLYISGFTADDVARRGVVHAGATILRKPFTPNKLAVAVREVLDATTTLCLRQTT